MTLKPYTDEELMEYVGADDAEYRDLAKTASLAMTYFILRTIAFILIVIAGTLIAIAIEIA